MKVSISKAIKDLYQESHKNYEYALESLMNSLDPATYVKAIKDIKRIDSISKERVEVEIPDSAVNMLKGLLDENEVKTETVELLLWVAVLMPEF